MKKFWTIPNIIYTVLFCLIANGSVFVFKNLLTLVFIIPFLVFLFGFGGISTLKTKKKRLKVCYHGGVLLTIFAVSLPVSAFYHTVLAFRLLPDNYKSFMLSTLFCVLIEGTLFLVGIVCVYCTSVQLGVEMRIKGLVCCMIPVWNLWLLQKMIVITMNEVKVEVEKEQLNQQRKHDAICKTKYPLLLVHGVFFRDVNLFNYWGRIPRELTLNGATIYYGRHQSAASVADSAKELNRRIRQIVEDTGCEKVNIIAHSKGGLDSRYAISVLGAAPYVASLTTINSPHRGCMFVDYLMKNAPNIVKDKIAVAYNSAMRKLGDENPDFIAAVTDLTAEACEKREELLTYPEGVFCQSVGSVQNKASNGKFPMNYSYHIVKYFDSQSDGIVGESSFAWGERYQLITVKGDRGVSHADMIDFTRNNIEEFDVREFYVQLVSDLRQRGL